MSIEYLIQTANTLYHRLVFLVGPRGDTRSEALGTLTAKHNWPVVNLSLAFSQRLIDVPCRHRAVVAPQALADLLGGINGDVLLLDHIEILFTPVLAQDPVRLLQGLSRNRTFVVSWPGVREGTTLIYGAPGHPEYYKQPVAGLIYSDVSDAEQTSNLNEGKANPS